MQGIAEFNWITALVGGMLVGVSAAVIMAFKGRITGITGMINSAITFKADEAWRWAFLVSVALGGALYQYVVAPRTGLPQTPTQSLLLWPMIIGGFAVGFGTRMGNGCTSGHGVCGLARFSPRSLVSVVTFMTTSIITVYIIRHALGLMYY